MCSIIQKMVALGNPIKGLPSNAAFHPTIQTVGFQSANFCKPFTFRSVSILPFTDHCLEPFIVYKAVIQDWRFRMSLKPLRVAIVFPKTLYSFFTYQKRLS